MRAWEIALLIFFVWLLVLKAYALYRVINIGTELQARRYRGRP